MDKKKNNKREREDDDAPVQAKKRIKVYEADDSDNYKHDPVFFPLKEDGRTIQTNLQAGLIANRILLVGDTARATKISKLFDDPENIIVVDSDKMYKTFTGTYRGVPISIMAIGMGFSRIDIAVREARQIITGPMAMMRLGTCGIINPDIGISKILVAAKGSLYIQSIKSAIVSGNDDSYYRISAPALPDEKLTSIIMKNMRNIVGNDNVVGVLNCTADSFYGSQGRPDHNFKDFNEDVVNNIPEVGSLEMETFGLLHLGTISEEPIYAWGAAIGLIQRNNPTKVTPHDKVKELENYGGLAIMKSFVEFEFPEGEPEYTNIVLENIKQYESETLKTHDAGVMAIDRLMGKNPELKKALDAL